MTQPPGQGPNPDYSEQIYGPPDPRQPAYPPPPGYQAGYGQSAYPPPGFAQGMPPAYPTPSGHDSLVAAGAGLALPPGVELASVGRRVGAYLLSIPLMVVTLGIGYLIWGAIVWGKGTSPALQVLGMRVWREQTRMPATWGTMALRNILGGIVQGILGAITEIISFVLFVSDDRRRTIPDRIATTVVVYDPGRVLG